MARQGQLDPAAFEAALCDETALASIMHANNETGAIFPIEQLARMAEARSVPLHTDATQTVGKLPVDVTKLDVSLLTMASHKFHGPKGVGALYMRRGVRVQPLLLGGHQEHDHRAGTENVAGVVGTGEALKLAIEHLDEETTRVREMRDRLEQGILTAVTGTHGIGDRERRLPNTADIAFEALQAEAILMLLSNEGICASSGSACSSGSLAPSHVLQAMGVPSHIGHGAIRFSLSRFNTDDDINTTLGAIPRIIHKLRVVELRIT